MAGKLLEILMGGVWHATSVVSFEAISADGFVKASPPTTQYENSFCRSLGRVSLFDFRDAPNLREAIERGDWTTFTNMSPEDVSVWLRIDHARISVPPCAHLLKEWNCLRENGQPLSVNMRIICDLETSHTGNLPTSAFSEVLLIDGESMKTIPFNDLSVSAAQEFFVETRTKNRTDFASLMRAAQRKPEQGHS